MNNLNNSEIYFRRDPLLPSYFFSSIFFNALCFVNYGFCLLYIVLVHMVIIAFLQ